MLNNIMLNNILKGFSYHSLWNVFLLLYGEILAIYVKVKITQAHKKKLSAPWIRPSYFYVFLLAKTEYDLGFILARLDFSV